MEKQIKFPESELAAELSALREELGRRDGTYGDATPDASFWIFRLMEGVSQDQWDELAARHDLKSWLTMPIDGDAFPHVKQFQKTLEKLAYQTDHDALTGLANRRAFDRFLDIEIERSKRSKTPLSLAVFDLDDFKRVNDTYGHPKGDEVLSAFAETMRANTRRYDLPARYGGEEFALIMAGSGLVKAQRLLDRLLDDFKRIEFSPTNDGETFNVTCSVGLTCYKGSVVTSVGELLELADTALYEAKQAGKDQVKVSRLSFVDDVPNDTLVQADEKQFLFGAR